MRNKKGKQGFIDSLKKARKEIKGTNSDYIKSRNYMGFFICPKIPMYSEFFLNFRPSPSKYREFYYHKSYRYGYAWWHENTKMQRIYFLNTLIKDLEAGKWDNIFK